MFRIKSVRISRTYLRMYPTTNECYNKQCCCVNFTWRWDRLISFQWIHSSKRLFPNDLFDLNARRNYFFYRDDSLFQIVVFRLRFKIEFVQSRIEVEAKERGRDSGPERGIRNYTIAVCPPFPVAGRSMAPSSCTGETSRLAVRAN